MAACADEIAELEKLLRVYGNAHFACGEHPDDAPIDEYDVLVEKGRDAERAIVEWVENREARIAELEAALADSNYWPRAAEAARRSK